VLCSRVRSGRGFQRNCIEYCRDAEDQVFPERLEFYGRVWPFHTLEFAAETANPALLQEGLERWRLTS
jgi:hypothetical protein